MGLIFNPASEIIIIMNQNLTSEYNEVMKNPDQYLDGIKHKFDGHQILLVTGFLAETLIKVSGYFDDQMKWFDESGIDYRRIKLESENSTAANAKVIVETIKNSKKPVYIISHSKGGLDTLDALLSHPVQWIKVKGWITVQTPFYGTAIVDILLGNPVSSSLIKKLLTDFFCGEEASVEDMRTQKRKDLQTRNKADIQKILEAIPVVSFASDAGNILTPLALIRDIVAKEEGGNDGLVSLKSGKLEGSDFVRIRGVDHAMTVMEWPWPLSSTIKKFNRVDFIKALLYLLLKQKMA